MHRKRNEVFRLFLTDSDLQKLALKADPGKTPLWRSSNSRPVIVRLDNHGWRCSCNKTVTEGSYRNIARVETWKDGVILYTKNGGYLPLPVTAHEKHNTVLMDMILLLQSRCLFGFREKEAVEFPEQESFDDRYHTEEVPKAVISFTLTEKELRRLCLWEYLIDDLALLPLVLTTLWALFSLWSLWFLVPTALCLVLFGYLTYDHIRTIAGFRRNHEGSLSLMLYSRVLVYRLREVDIDLELEKLKKLAVIFGVWRIAHGNFFVLRLPARIVREEAAFFAQLRKSISP